MKRTLSYSALFTILLASSIQAFGAQYSIRFDQAPIRTGYIRTDYCLGSEFQMKTGLHISKAENISIHMRARSFEQSRDNRLIVNDNFGVPLDTSSATLLNQSYPISIQVYSFRNSDICLNSEREGMLENIEMEYSINESRPPQPPRPPIPPTDTVIGTISTITETGEVFGWGCDTSSRQEIGLNVYINGNPYRNIRPEGNLDTRDDNRMGLPDRACGNYSGFKFSLPKQIMYGQRINIEVRGEQRNGYEKSFGVINYVTPVYYLERGLFQVVDNDAIYFSNGESAYCHITTPDQVRLFLKEGLNDPKIVTSKPIGMRFDKQCELKNFPLGFFRTTKTNNTQAVYFSNGTSYCWVPMPGMISHIADKNRVKTDLASYDNLPSNMQYTSLCKAEGLFSVGTDVYYSNGVNAFCHVLNASTIENKKVYPYTQLPPEQRNDGNCQ